MNRLSLSLLLVGIGMIVGLTTFASEDKSKSGTKEVFPSKIESFVTENIPDGKIVKFKHENDKMEIKCSDGTEVNFNHNVEWIKMENDKVGLNNHLISHLPDAAVLYLKNNYNKVAVLEIAKKSFGYKVELRTTPNECDIWFNGDGSVRKDCDY